MKATGVKICGVTRVEDAELAVKLGADFIGLNFWPRSPRFVEISTAERIAATVAGRSRLVGVWVDPDRNQVVSAAAALPLDLFQFHGGPGAEVVDWFPRRVVRAVRLGGGSQKIDLAAMAGAWGFLFDCAPDGVYGGTGVAWAYERIANLETDKPVFLAGGLGPENVAGAIERSRVEFVDVCSGVEARPGIKDPEKMRRFFREVQHANSRS